CRRRSRRAGGLLVVVRQLARWPHVDGARSVRILAQVSLPLQDAHLVGDAGRGDEANGLTDLADGRRVTAPVNGFPDEVKDLPLAWREVGGEHLGQRAHDRLDGAQFLGRAAAAYPGRGGLRLRRMCRLLRNRLQRGARGLAVRAPPPVLRFLTGPLLGRPVPTGAVLSSHVACSSLTTERRARRSLVCSPLEQLYRQYVDGSNSCSTACRAGFVGVVR